MRKLVLGVLVVVLLLAGGAYYYVFGSINYTTMNPLQQQLTTSIAQKWQAYMDSMGEENENKVTREELFAKLNPLEQHFADKILTLPGKDIGWKGAYYGTDAPGELAFIENKKFVVAGAKDGEYETGAQWYPKAAYADFQKMVAAMKKDINKEIWIDSGYRSPGKQGFLFIKYLADPTDGNFNITFNATSSALPGYSEHGYGKTPAFDYALEGGDSLFVTGSGTKMTPEQKFTYLENTPEHKWLLQNAATYHFFLSYPKNNPAGVSYEPWHWRYDVSAK